MLRKDSNPLTQGAICVLGAIDGLIIGIAVEALRIFYEKYQIERAMQEATQHNISIGYMLNPMIDVFTPGVCAVIFAGVSHLVYRYFLDRPQFLLRLWLAIGITAVLAGYYMTPLNQNSFPPLYLVLFSSISYLVYRRWENYSHSLLLLWQVIGSFAVLIIAAGMQIIGLFTVQRSELRKPLLWLTSLILALVINTIYGVFVQLAISRYPCEKVRIYN